MEGADKSAGASVGVICCRVLEREIRALVVNVPQVTRVEVMEWGLHVRPDRLLEALCEKIRTIQGEVGAVMLGYGRCQALDRLPSDFAIPVFRPQGEDCIGVLLGQDRYEMEQHKTPGTWFLTPGWTELGMEFIFEELQAHRLAESGYNPLDIAHRMLKGYSRALLIDMQLNENASLEKKAFEIAEEFGWELKKTMGSFQSLKNALHRAVEAAYQKRKPDFTRES